MENPTYEYTDKVIRYLTRRFIAIFSNAKSKVLAIDELNIIKYSHTLYDELEEIAEEYLLKIAQKSYSSIRGSNGKIDRKWLKRYLSEYDPVTLYVYLHEVDRKRAYFAESVIASNNRAAECEKALRYWANMVNQYAVDITDKATIEAYRDDDVEKVIWTAVDDEKRCEECAKLDNKVFDIDDIPPKPHWNCRCIVVPFIEEE